MAPLGLGLGAGFGGRPPASTPVPQQIANLAFFFDARDAVADGSGNLTGWSDITGTWTLAPVLANDTIKVKTDHANGVQCVEVQGRSDEARVNLTGDGRVDLAAGFTFGTVFAVRSNNIDGFIELGDTGGFGTVHRLVGFTSERGYVVGLSTASRDVAMTDDKAAHHKVIHSDTAQYKLRNHENTSTTGTPPAATATPATRLVLGGSPALSVSNTGDGYYWAIYAYHRDIAGADLAALDAWIQSQFNCSGLASTA